MHICTCVSLYVNVNVHVCVCVCVCVSTGLQFFSVLHFCRVFRTTLELPLMDANQLEHALVRPLTSQLMQDVVCRLLFGKRPSGKVEQQRQRDIWQEELKTWLDGVGFFKEEVKEEEMTPAADGPDGEKNNGAHAEGEANGMEGEKQGEEEEEEKQEQKEEQVEEEVEVDEDPGDLYIPFEDWDEDAPNPLTKGGFFGIEATMRLRVRVTSHIWKEYVSMQLLESRDRKTKRHTIVV